MAVFCTESGDRGVGVDRDAFGEGDAAAIGWGGRVELIDEAIAFEEERSDAEGQVQLGGGQAARLVLPADVVGGDLRAVDDDLIHVFRTKSVFRLKSADRIQAGVVAADAGVELERDAHRLPCAPEAGGELREVEAVARAGEGGAEAAVFALEDVLDAGEAALGEERTVEAALRGAAGVHALNHGAVLRSHQARGLSPGDAQRMHASIYVEV